MKRYIVRTNCEWSIVITADSAEEAIRQADQIPHASIRWDQAWAVYEAELEDGDEEEEGGA